MPSYRYGGKRGRKRFLRYSDDYLVVRTHSRDEIDPDRLTSGCREAFTQFELSFGFPEAGVQVHKAVPARRSRPLRDRTRRLLKSQPDVEFAGRVLCEAASRTPLLYTENIFVKFDDRRTTSWCKRVLERHGLSVKRPLKSARNALFVGAPPGCGTTVFDIAEGLLAEDDVELCHPELIKPARRRRAFSQQWHLKRITLGNHDVDAHASVEAAWPVSQGEGIVVAVIDDGFDVDHEEFAGPGKVVFPRDATLRNEDPRPASKDDHGTACAGIACAAGLHGASGVAPQAKLMPIRLTSGIGSLAEHDALMWAAEHGADVISCSWGPKDGDWRNHNDPAHSVIHELPDSTRQALEWAVNNGRGGKGCVITWAAGNGGESVDNDHYASNPHVIAVAACTDRGKHSPYSDRGRAVWCCFPSDDRSPSSLTRGIWTTDRSGKEGYNRGVSRKGDRKGHYTNRFGGTSASCPGVAGVAALVLAVRPELSWQQVRTILKDSCDRIDAEQGDYDDASGHSPLYGYGRVNAKRAVQLATAGTPGAPRGLRARARRKALVPRGREVTVKLTSAAPVATLRIDDRALSLHKGQGRVTLEPGQDYVLSWWIEGPPGTPYTIDVSSKHGEVRGRWPVSRTVPRGRRKAAGHKRLSSIARRGRGGRRVK